MMISLLSYSREGVFLSIARYAGIYRHAAGPCSSVTKILKDMCWTNLASSFGSQYKRVLLKHSWNWVQTNPTQMLLV